MKWAFSIHPSVKAAVLLFTVLLAVLISDVYKQSNVQDLDGSVSAIYDDRLVPATYVFELTDHLYSKRLLWSEARRPGRAEAVREELARHDAAIDKLLKGFAATSLVDAERRALAELEARWVAGQELEEQWVAEASEERIPAMTAEFDQAMHQISLLSRIQEQVGQDLKKESRSLLASSSILSHLELGLLIVIGLLIQSLPLLSRAEKAPRRQTHEFSHLN